MTSNNWETLGENIRDIVQSAVDSQDYRKLNQTINTALNVAAQEMQKGMQNAAKKNAQQNKTTTQKATQRTTQSQQYYQRQALQLYGKTTKTQVFAILFMIFGYSLGAAFGITFLAILFSTLLILSNGAMFVLTIIFGILFVLSMLLGYKGTTMYTQIRRFQNYTRAIGTRTTVPVEQLSYVVHKPENYVKSDLESMIKKRWFLQGHLDYEGKNLLLTHQAYNEYLKSLKKQGQPKPNAHVSDDVKDVVELGRHYIDQIRQCNDDIPGVDISNKISRIEVVVQKIFKRVEQHPENIRDIRKFMKYYLPTTIKLLKAYAELDQQPVQGENILNSKKEIEDTLDTLNYAFEKLLDDLFRDTAWDVSSDVTVLENMLAQEGLTKKKLYN